MNILADTMTALRCVFVLIILYAGVVQGSVEGLATAVSLTILAWITDVLDGMLARKASRPTHLGSWDLLADLGLTLSLAASLVAWGALPLLLALGVLAVAGLSARTLHAMAPMQLAMGFVYGTFILTVWSLSPGWGHTLVGSIGFLAILNPQRTREQVGGFLGQAGTITRRRSSQATQASRKGGN